MAGFWNADGRHVTLWVDRDASEVHRSVVAGVVECISYSDWVAGKRVQPPPLSIPFKDRYTEDYKEKARRARQEYEALKAEIHAAHRAGQLSPSSCVVRGVQLRRTHVERLLHRLGRPAKPISTPADVATLVSPEPEPTTPPVPVTTKPEPTTPPAQTTAPVKLPKQPPPTEPKEWLAWAQTEHPRTEGQTVKEYADFLYGIAPVSVRRRWQDAKTLRARLYDRR
jgi:hypothetical protein